MLKINNITKSYANGGGGSANSRFFAIKDISFTVERGELFGIVGLSGSGKTTLLRTILQLTNPDSGSVLFRNSELTDLDEEALREEVRPRLRKVYQHPEASLNPGLQVAKIISQPIALYNPRMNKNELEQQTEWILQQVGLPLVYKTKYPFQLSGGEKRRVALARAIATKPEVLFADEPFAGLDKALQYRMLKLLMDIKRERNLTIVMVSHDIDVIRHVCDRIMTLKGGQIADIKEAGSNGVPVNMDHFR